MRTTVIDRGRRKTQVSRGRSSVEMGTEDLEATGPSTAEIDLDERAFGRYDASEGWTVDAGSHVVSVGRSSRDRRGSARIGR